MKDNDNLENFYFNLMFIFIYNFISLLTILLYVDLKIVIINNNINKIY
jgi:hypothetical protein